MNPCIEFCHIRHGKEYSKECDDHCDYAKTIKNYKGVIDRVLEIIDEEAKKLELGGYGKVTGKIYYEEIKRAVLALKGGGDDA